MDFLFEDYYKRAKIFVGGECRLAHYTSAAAALSVIEGNNLWMRRISLMNDFSEFSYGAFLIKNWAVSNETLLKNATNKFNFNFFELLTFQNHQKWNEIKSNTYATSMSEHIVQKDSNGKLSMWRGYGEVGGVALIIKPDFVNSYDENSSAHPVPARYWDASKLNDSMDEMFQKIIKAEESMSNKKFLEKEIPFQIILFLASIKHPGFEEEKEWKLVANVKSLGNGLLTEKVETIYNLPQKILSLDLGSQNKYTLKNILSHIIVGPSSAANEIADALKFALEKKAIKVPIVISNIPYRSKL